MNSETIIAVCEKDMTFIKQQRKYYRHIIRTDPQHLQTQLSRLYAQSLLNQPTHKTSEVTIDNERDTTLLEENQKLKDELFELKQMVENTKKGFKKKLEQIKQERKQFNDTIKQKDLEIKNLKYDKDILTKKLNNVKNGIDINKGISVMDQEISDCESDYNPYSDEEDPANQLNKDL